jgi:hypothetical protein
MAITSCETIQLKTPQGHDVLAEIDYEHFEIRRAKVVHCFTGVIKPLDEETSAVLARALQAKQRYEQALLESRAVEDTMHAFGILAEALGKEHPAMQPYWQEIARHQSVADDMSMRAREFYEKAMRAIDKLAQD